MTEPVLHSYSLRNYGLDTLLDFAVDRGWASIELASCHQHDEPAAAVRQAQRAGVGIETLGFFTDVAVPIAADRDRATAELIELVRLCGQLGVPKLNGFAGWVMPEHVSWSDWRAHGGRLASSEQRAWFVDAFAEVGKEAAAQGVTVFVEVHPNTLHDTVRAAGDLLARVGDSAIGLTLDPGNSAVLDARDADARNLPDDGFPLYFHFKNYLQNGEATTFDVDADLGVLDLRSWLYALPVDTTVCIEYPGRGDPFPRLAAARRYYETIMSDGSRSALGAPAS